MFGDFVLIILLNAVFLFRIYIFWPISGSKFIPVLLTQPGSQNLYFAALGDLFDQDD